MHILNVVILTHNSLLSGGIASKLREYKESLDVQTLDLKAKNVLKVLKQKAPDVIILDAGDSKICAKTPIVKLLEAAPNAKVIRLDLESDSVKVFSSTEKKVAHAHDLVKLIQFFSGADTIL